MHESTRLGGESLVASIKAAPAVSVSALAIGGVGLQDWVFVATLVYLALQGAYLCWRWLRDLRRDRAVKVEADV